MKSETGSILTKIAGIINLVLAAIIFVFGLVAMVGFSIYNGTPFLLSKTVNLLMIFIILSIVLFALGMLMLKSSKKMQNTKTVRNGAIWAIILGVLNLSFLTGVLSLVGGIIGLIDADKKNENKK